MWVVSSIPRQEPYDIGTDKLGRRIFVFNVDAEHEAETDADANPAFYAALGARLRTGLSLTARQTYLLGQRVEALPDVDGPIVRVCQTAGLPADMTHGDLLAFRRPGAQVMIFGRDEEAVVKLAYRAHTLCAFVNTNLTA